MATNAPPANAPTKGWAVYNPLANPIQQQVASPKTQEKVSIYDLNVGDKVKIQGTSNGTIDITIFTIDMIQSHRVYDNACEAYLVKDIIEIVEKHNKTPAPVKAGCTCDLITLMARGCPSASGGKCNSIQPTGD